MKISKNTDWYVFAKPIGLHEKKTERKFSDNANYLYKM